MPKGKYPKFRQNALAKLDTPEHLDTLIQVVSPKSWVILAAFYILLFGLLLWGFLGSIPTRVEGRGLLLVENGTVYNAVAPPGGGRVIEILTVMGKKIKKGDTVAILERSDLVQQIELEKKYLETLKSEHTELEQISEQEIESRALTLSKEKKILENTIDIEKHNLNDIEKLLKFKEENFKKGLVVLQDIETTRRDFYAAKQKAEELQIELHRLKTQEADFRDQWRQRLREKELALLNAELKLHNMQSDMEISKNVTSPKDGTVISINTALGKMVNNGDPIISIASEGQGLDAIVFMAPHEGQRVAPNMMALITPITIEREEYGSMKGNVLTVSAFPEAMEAMMAVLHNQELVKQFSETGPPTAIRVRIERDANTFSGYRWTSSQGPKIKIMPGTLANIRITVREQAPISLILPSLKKMFGI